MEIIQNISLKPLNSFGIDVNAKYFAPFSSVDDLKDLIALKPSVTKLILGGGSNILFTKNFDGLILKNDLKGIKLVKEDAHHYYIKAAAGENWHQFVIHCINNNYAGLENLSLIPGNVGASPIQNIGAYGIEIKDVFESLEALNKEDNSIHTFTTNDCKFGYRESVFKKEHQNQFVILYVTFRLNKEPVFNTSYGVIEQELERMHVKDLSIKAISQAVINIRTSKLPDPKVSGNAGSFFKNPTIKSGAVNKLKQNYSTIPYYTLNNDYVKIPAAWLIEQCGWKGYRKEDAGVHPLQPLVLVNYGNANGKEIYNLSEKIQQSVNEKFGIKLEREVNII